MPSLELTEKQSAVLDFIKSFIATEGFPPTFKEIARNFGYASDNSAVEHVIRLKKKGYISVKEGSQRSIKCLV